MHAKLFSLHGTAAPGDQWQALSSDITTHLDRYPGYVSFHDGDRADDDALAKRAAKIRDHA